MWRAVKILLGLYLIANIIGAYFYWHRIDQFIRFMPRVSEASFAPPKDELEAQKQDFTYLKTILDYDRSFSESARAAFTTEIDELLSQNAALSDAEFYLKTRELMAIADNAHTGAQQSPAFRTFNRSGVDVYPFANGLFIVRAHNSRANLLGQKLVQIEGQSIKDIMSSLGKYTGGVKQWRDLQSLFFLRSPELLYAAGIAPNPNSLTITVENSEGKVSDIKLNALDSAKDTDFYFRHAHLTLAPMALKDEGADWVHSLNIDQDDPALYLQEIFKPFKSVELDGGLYVRSSYLMSTEDNPIKQQLLQVIETAPSGGYDFLVLDLRWNPGGDYGNAVSFARNAAQATSEGGPIYVIVGPNTFSASIVFAALLKQYAPNKTILIGEPMGDRAQFWAERGKPFILPNSDYWIGYSVGYHDWENGCTGTHKYCFPPNKKFDINIGSLSLDHVIQPSYADYKSGRDIVMDWVLRQQSN